MIIDATNHILGRTASIVAKKALLGEEIIIINCEKIIISGPKKFNEKRYIQRKNRGDPRHGPYFPKTPDRILRRAIRGMLPYDKEHGRKALKSVKCYMGVPDNIKDKKIEKIENSFNRLKTLNQQELIKISRKLGAKI